MTTKTYSFMDHVLEHTPEIKDLVAKYLEYEYIMTSQMCTPQKQAKDYDPNEESQFLFEVYDPLITDDERVMFTVTKKGVQILAAYGYKNDEDCDFVEEHTMTHEDCLAYLAQLPKTWHHFSTYKED